MEDGATVPFAFLPWGAVPFPTLPWGSTPQTWPPILTELVGINNYLNSKILTLRPCRRTLWQSQVSCLLPCRLDNILIGSVACCVLLFDFCFANIVCWGVYWLNGFYFPYYFSLPFLARRGKNINAKTQFFYGFGLWKKVTEISSKFSKNELPCR